MATQLAYKADRVGVCSQQSQTISKTVGGDTARQLLHNTGQIATTYAYHPFGVPLAGDVVPNPWRFTGEA